MSLQAPDFVKNKVDRRIKMLSRKLHLLIAAIFLAGILLMPVSPVQANTSDLPELEDFIDNLMLTQMEALHIPNAAISIVAGDEVLFQKGYGFADLEESRPVEIENTLFRVGSVSKLFTWTAIMQLVEQGKLDLNADVNNYLDFQIPSTLLYPQGNSEPTPITLAHLMTHTAGFEAYPDEIFKLDSKDLLPLDEYVREKLPARLFPPGEVAAYSNYGAALAGYIVERVSGQPFAEYIEQHIFRPLGMNQSTFLQPVPAQLSASLAHPYRFVDGAYLPGGFEFMQMPEGGMSSTAADMAKFMSAHLQGGRLNDVQVLQPNTLRLMHTRQPAPHPALGGMALGFMQGTFNGQPVLFHGGSTMIFDSGLYLLPEQNIGVFITYSGANHLFHTNFFHNFMDHYFPANEAPVPQEAEGMRARASSFAGEYHQNTRSFTTDEKLTSLQLGVINVAVDEEGYLLITHVGETNRFVEIEPGVYQNLREGRTQDYFGPFRTVVFDMDPLGRTLLISDGPMTYSQAPWYASSSFTVLILAAILLLALISIIVWGLGFLIGRLRRQRSSPSKAATTARWVAVAFALLTLVFLAGVVVTGAPDPVYLLPPPAFGVLPGWNILLDLLPWILVCLGAAVVVFAILGWAKGYWRLAARIHYTFLMTAALLLMWIFVYWNIL
jgi:CubicO group peptidase (beta-lactamase class C family)